jgi:hypothetical protein
MTLLVEATGDVFATKISKFDLKFVEEKGAGELDQGKCGVTVAKVCRSERKKKEGMVKSEGKL